MAYYDFKDSNTVHIKYKDPIAAFYCQQFLDGEYISSLKAHLIVKWIDHPPEGLKRAQKSIRKAEEAKEESEGNESDIKLPQIQKSPIFSVQTDFNQISAPISTKEEHDSPQALMKITDSMRKEGSESTKAHLAEIESQQYDLATNIKLEISQNWNDIDTPHHTMFYKEAIHDLSQATDDSLPGMNAKLDIFPQIANGSEFGYAKPPYLGTPPTGNWFRLNFNNQYPLAKQDQQVSDESTIKKWYFELQIESDKEFNVKSRILGAMGWNMKRIEEKCNIDKKDSVKLNFVTKDLSKDNETDEDNDDWLLQEPKSNSYASDYFDLSSNNSLKKWYLMVKSRSFQDYSKAVVLIQELLINVYEDYKRYWERLKKKPIWGGLIKKTEIVVGDRKTISRVINP